MLLLLLGKWFVGRLSLSLQDDGVLRWLSVNRLAGQLGVNLLWPRWALVLLVLLVLLRSLQDLRRELPRHTTHHAGKRRLTMGELLRRVAMSKRALRHCCVRRGRSMASTLGAHHSLDLVQAHQLPRWCDLG